MLNELRIGDTRRSVSRSAVQLDATASAALGLPGIPAGAQFDSTLPTFLMSGYQQLGSPPNTATEFETGVTQIANTFTWLLGRHTLKVGADLRWERLNVVQPPSPTGSFIFSSLFTDLPGVSGTGTPFASFLLGQVQQFSIDLQEERIRNRASIQEYFVQDDWRVSNRVTGQCGRALHVELSLDREEQPGGGLQPRDARTGIPGPKRPASGRPRAASAQPRASPGHRRPPDGPHGRTRGLRPHLDRTGRDHDAVHDAGVPLLADRVTAHAGQRRARIPARERTQRRPHSTDTGCGPRAGGLLGGP